MKMKMLLASAAMLVGVVGANSAFAASETLENVKKRGVLNCAVNTGLAGFAAPDTSGVWKGFDIDVCRAVATAIFNDPDKVNYTPTTAKERFTVLQSGETDLLARNTTWTLSRDTKLGLDFVGVNYYDGQGFMVRKDLGLKSAKELSGASVCVQTGTTTEKNVADYYATHKMDYNSVVFEQSAEARTAYDKGRCDVFTTDASGLAAERTLLSNPADHMILPEIISKEPLGPVVRHGDNEWGDIVRWALNAMIIAEEFGVTSKNVADMKAKTENPELQRLLGVQEGNGKMLGLGDDFAFNIISKIGNYGEVFERNIGKDTALGLDRGLNQLWSKGGILYAPPFR